MKSRHSSVCSSQERIQHRLLACPVTGLWCGRSWETLTTGPNHLIESWHQSFISSLESLHDLRSRLESFFLTPTVPTHQGLSSFSPVPQWYPLCIWRAGVIQFLMLHLDAHKFTVFYYSLWKAVFSLIVWDNYLWNKPWRSLDTLWL